jgi:hypothetical protein
MHATSPIRHENDRPRLPARPAAPLALAVLALALAGCSGSGGAAPAAPPASRTASPAPSAAAFGTAERVTDAGDGSLTVTPVAAWWLPGNIQSRDHPRAVAQGRERAENGRFLIIELRVAAATSSAQFPAAMSGSGADIVSAHDEFSPGDSASAHVVWNTCLPAVDSDEPLHPGSARLDGLTYDVPPGPALLEWTGNAHVTTWRVPATSTGPLPARVMRAIRSGKSC